MKPYKPSNKVPLIAVAWLVLAISSGVLIGGLAFLVSHVIYLVIIFPVVLGLVGGDIISKVVNTGKMRNPLLAGLSGALIAITIYGSIHYCDYLFFRRELATVISQKVSDSALVDPMIDGIIIRETSLSGFWGYLAIAANEGVKISEVFGSGSLSLGQHLTIEYWLIELVIIAAISASLAFNRARQPFSEKRNEWYPAARLLGSISDTKANEFLHLIEIGDFGRIGETIEEDIPFSSIFLYLQSFDSSLDESLLTARIFLDERKRILQGTLSPSQASALMRGINAQKISQLAT